MKAAVHLNDSEEKVPLYRNSSRQSLAIHSFKTPPPPQMAFSVMFINILCACQVSRHTVSNLILMCSATIIQISLIPRLPLRVIRCFHCPAFSSIAHQASHTCLTTSIFLSARGRSTTKYPRHFFKLFQPSSCLCCHSLSSATVFS